MAIRDVFRCARMVSLVYHRPHCFALGKTVTITADRCNGPRTRDPEFPRKCIREVCCFYMKAKIKGQVVLRNPLAESRADGSFEPVGPEAGEGQAGQG
jgi:hypothetical protein